MHYTEIVSPVKSKYEGLSVTDAADRVVPVAGDALGTEAISSPEVTDSPSPNLAYTTGL